VQAVLWAPIVSAAMGAGSMIYGAISNASAKNKQRSIQEAEQARLEREKREHQEWYEREYYQNLLDTDEAKAAQAQASEYLAEENKKADAQAAMTGASDEARIARRGESQKAWTGLVRGLSAKGTDYKRALNSQYMQGKLGYSAQASGLAGQQMAMEQERANSGTAMIGNGMMLGGSAIMGMGSGSNIGMGSRSKGAPNPALMNAKPMELGLGNGYGKENNYGWKS